MHETGSAHEKFSILETKEADDELGGGKRKNHTEVFTAVATVAARKRMQTGGGGESKNQVRNRSSS